jgi:cell division protein FtsQ
MSTKRTSSRAESVRQKRRSGTQKSRAPKRKSRASSKSGYRELPPITTRGVVNEFAIERRKKAGKRRYNAAFSLPRSLLHVLPLPLPRTRIRPGWRLLSFALVLVLGTALYFFWTLPMFRVTAAKITGNQRISTDEINAALELNGNPVFLQTPAQVRERALQAYPELASVDVTIDLPNIVSVKVTEREPVIQWQQDGGYAWIDETGTAFRPRGEAQSLIVVQALGAPPAITSPDTDPLLPAPFISEEMVKALTALAPYAPAGTPILYDPAAGLSWTDSRGWQAIFGTGSADMEQKVRVYQAMVDWLTQRGIRPTLINVAYPGAPFYRVEQVDVQPEEQ